MEGFIQQYDGDWMDITDRQRISCCECGLIHNVEYVILRGRILERAFRDARRTASYRRRKAVRESIKKLKG